MSKRVLLPPRLGTLVLVLWAGCCRAESEARWTGARAAVQQLGALTQAPAMAPAEGRDSDGNLRPIFFDGLPWKGKPTKVFAWLGMPTKEQALGKAKVPGVVLVHGGGGTAFSDWVKKWNAEGFAAISIAVEGQTDQRSTSNPKAWARHDHPGPARSGIYHDSDEPLADQWMYHAVADTVLAHSLLRSLPEVDKTKVGLAGISWGGVITSTVMGIDSRFAFAIPIYGCGGLAEAPNQYGRALGQNDMYRKVWDPMLRLEKASMPALWLSWPNDSHFPMDRVAACTAAAAGPQMVSLVPGMRHGHAPGWNRPESYAFAHSVVATGKPWAAQQRIGVSGGKARVNFRTKRTLDRGELVSTTDTGVSGARKWVSTSASVARKGDQWALSAPLPAGTTAWYLNGISGEVVLSSTYQEVPGGAQGATGAKGRRAPAHQPDTYWNYKEVGGKAYRMSVFLPEGYEQGKAFPAFVVFHGGSWRTGEANWHYPDCAYWRSRGMIAVSVDYRLKDRDKVDVPLACVKDAKSAVRYLRAHAERLKVDPDRVVVAGGSAGGQMAAATAMLTAPDTNEAGEDTRVSCVPNAVVLYNPYFRCAAPLSPPNFVKEGLPPMITFLGDEDPAIPVESLVDFTEALRKQQNAAEFYVGIGGKHGLCNGRNPNNPFFYWSVELTDRFLVKHKMLQGAATVQRPEGVKALQAPADFTAY